MSEQAAAVIEQHDEPEDDLRRAFAELKGANDAPEPVKEAPAETKVETPVDGRQRDATGKFAKAEAAPAEAAPVVDPAAAPVPAVSAVKVPEGWSAEMKAVFNTLDPKVQAEISRRETDLTRKITSQDDDRSLGKRIREASLPYAAIMNAEGATADAAFKQYLNTAYVLRTGTPQAKVQAIQAIAQQFNVPLHQALQQQPQINPIIETLQQRLDRIERDRQAETQERQQQENASIQSTIDAFSNSPGHEHFETVKPLMGTLLSSGQATDMQDAYDRACWADPDIRSTLTAAADGKRVAEQAAKAEAAKKAAGSVTGGPGGAKPLGNASGSAGSVEDDLRAAFRAHQGRV